MDFEEWESEHVTKVLGAGAVLGTVWAEVAYFQYAEPRRLLIVLLLLPGGAVLGTLATGVLWIALTRIVPALAVLIAAGIILVASLWLAASIVSILWNITF